MYVFVNTFIFISRVPLDLKEFLQRYEVFLKLSKFLGLDCCPVYKIIL